MDSPLVTRRIISQVQITYRSIRDIKDLIEVLRMERVSSLQGVRIVGISRHTNDSNCRFEHNIIFHSEGFNVTTLSYHRQREEFDARQIPSEVEWHSCVDFTDVVDKGHLWSKINEQIEEFLPFIHVLIEPHLVDGAPMLEIPEDLDTFMAEAESKREENDQIIKDIDEARSSKAHEYLVRAFADDD